MEQTGKSRVRVSPRCLPMKHSSARQQSAMHEAQSHRQHTHITAPGGVGGGTDQPQAAWWPRQRATAGLRHGAPCRFNTTHTKVGVQARSTHRTEEHCIACLGTEFAVQVVAGWITDLY